MILERLFLTIGNGQKYTDRIRETTAYKNCH